MIAAMAGLLLATVQPVAPSMDPADFDPATGYRISHYRGVVPGAPDGVDRLSSEEAAQLAQRHRAIFIDVTPSEGGVRDIATGRWRLASPHETIPGAHWFPEAGRGVPADGIEPWFITGVERLAARHSTRPVVVFCLADCWMSWNAALRLHRAGLPDVRWYADGLDGWREMKRPLVKTHPH